jgi:protein ImuB
MEKRFAAIWFRHLTTDGTRRRHPELRGQPFVLAAPEHGRMVVKACSQEAASKGIAAGMAVADGRALLPGLKVLEDKPEFAEKLLGALAEWCLRYTPAAAIDLPDGLVLDISGCPHLWGGERNYLKDIVGKLRGYGYDVRAAIAGTIGAAWAVSRYGQLSPIIDSGAEAAALASLPPAALRLEPAVAERLHKLGLHEVQSFIELPRPALRRRFGPNMLSRIDEALGAEIEFIQPIQPASPYLERLPCAEPICTAKGIEIALKKLLGMLHERLQKEGNGVRSCIFKGYRLDKDIQQIAIATNRASRNTDHLFKLFEIRICRMAPDLGFELFTLEAPVVEEVSAEQDSLWVERGAHDDIAIAELLDRIAGKVGPAAIRRYLPAEHYWPERSFKTAAFLQQKPETAWRSDLTRPLHLLPRPEAIEVSAPIPDYPPMLFRHRGLLHKIKKADGPERIEQEWWLQQGLYRDYYQVEDENGCRYWLFRSGDYQPGRSRWFIHGIFA